MEDIGLPDLPRHSSRFDQNLYFEQRSAREKSQIDLSVNVITIFRLSKNKHRKSILIKAANLELATFSILELWFKVQYHKCAISLAIIHCALKRAALDASLE